MKKITEAAMQSAVNQYQHAYDLARTQKDDYFAWVQAGKSECLAHYQPLFSPKNIGSISTEEFKSFLNLSNNHHWSGIHRHGNHITKDMDKLHLILSVLVDENGPINERLNEIRPNKGPQVPWLGRAILTPILLVAYPEKYGVWNDISNSNLNLLQIMPEFDPDCPFGDRYVEVNRILKDLARRLQIDLWTLDNVDWKLNKLRQPTPLRQIPA
jgi:hypothetical protein